MIIIFDDWLSVFHAILGIATIFVNPWISIFIISTFIIYEIIETIGSDIRSAIGDILEFMCGVGIGSIIAKLIYFVVY